MLPIKWFRGDAGPHHPHMNKTMAMQQCGIATYQWIRIYFDNLGTTHQIRWPKITQQSSQHICVLYG